MSPLPYGTIDPVGELMAFNLIQLDQELQAMEKRTKLLQDIKRLADDPEGKALLEKFVLNGSASPAYAEVGNLVTPIPPPTQDYAGLSQIDSVRRAIAKRNGSRFVVSEIGNDLRGGGLDIDNIAVGRVLRRLHKAEELKIALEGGGNVAHQYEATDAFRPA